ncbi:hypothetical protein K474DRAFT_1695314 [Panus rudis PR-1116 ss-1]|nr:hypothetical protein K474DRAFT_1695314 [Panus rudis PR-1116 ss-1]
MAMGESIFEVLAAETVLHIFFYLSVPELCRLLRTSTKCNAFAFQVLLEHFQRHCIVPISRRPYNNSCWVFAIEVLFTIPGPAGASEASDPLPVQDFQFGGFQIVEPDYWMDGYSSSPIPAGIIANYDAMRDRRARDMPLPTRCLAFILQNTDPVTKEEKLAGYPCAFIEEWVTEETRTRHDLAHIDHTFDPEWKNKVMCSTKKSQLLDLQHTFRPFNSKEQGVGAFWTKPNRGRVYFSPFETCLDWRFSMPFRGDGQPI